LGEGGKVASWGEKEGRRGRQEGETERRRWREAPSTLDEQRQKSGRPSAKHTSDEDKMKTMRMMRMKWEVAGRKR
jgi:hypothetical protein